MTKPWKRITAVLLCMVMLLTAQAVPLYAADGGDQDETSQSESEAEDETEDSEPEEEEKDDSYKEEISDINAKIEALKKEQAAIQADIDKTKNDKNKKEKEKQQLQNQVYMKQQEIELLAQRIQGLEGTIGEKEQDIIDKEAEIDKNYDLYKQRLREMYKRDNATALGVILGADSYADFLSGAEMMRRISEHDDKLISELVDAKHAIEQALAEIQAAKKQVEEDKADVSTQKAQLATKEKQVAAQIQDIEQLQKEFEAEKAKRVKEQKEAEAEVARIIAENASIGDYVGGTFMWPVSGFTTITSAFGWRFNNSDYHTGIDIAGRNASGSAIYRQPIRAANAGKVIYASNNYTPGRGYGRYVIVDHGGNWSTLYGHADYVSVSVGDYVEKGAVLGQVGTTGWSTGPHLHFEIRENGAAQNPMNHFR